MGQQVAVACKFLEVLAISSANWLVYAGTHNRTGSIIGGYCVSVYGCYQYQAANSQSLSHHFEVVQVLVFWVCWVFTNECVLSVVAIDFNCRDCLTFIDFYIFL